MNMYKILIFSSSNYYIKYVLISNSNAMLNTR